MIAKVSTGRAITRAPVAVCQTVPVRANGAVISERRRQLLMERVR
jgi:hypothetical protein